MMYLDFGFTINEQGLLFHDKPDPDDTHMVRISGTTFKPGDKFTLELDEFNRMFFRKDSPAQLNLEL